MACEEEGGSWATRCLLVFLIEVGNIGEGKDNEFSFGYIEL